MAKREKRRIAKLKKMSGEFVKSKIKHWPGKRRAGWIPGTSQWEWDLEWHWSEGEGMGMSMGMGCFYVET